MHEKPISTRELYDRYVIPTYGRFDLRLARGLGSEVWDEDGKRYLDFGAGIAVTSIGHAHPRVVRVMQEQIGTLVHTSNLYYTRPQALLAERLVRLTGAPGKVFFCNSGAEANEALYKLARKFGNDEWLIDRQFGWLGLQMDAAHFINRPRDHPQSTDGPEQ